MTKAELLATARRIEREAEQILATHCGTCHYCDFTERGSVLTHETCATGNILERAAVNATWNALRAWANHKAELAAAAKEGR